MEGFFLGFHEILGDLKALGICGYPIRGNMDMEGM